LTSQWKAGKITIAYRSGATAEGIVLTHHGNTLSVAVRDCDDASLFTCVRGTWIAEDLEPVTIQSGWHSPARPITEADCICSKDLAARLIRALVSGEEPEDEMDTNFELYSYTPMAHKVV
jgi:hypothetical protein